MRPKQKHNERCKECKKRIAELLSTLYGEVKVNYNIKIPSHPDYFKDTSHYKPLIRIFKHLQRYRGYKVFMHTKKLPNVDFFVPSVGLIVEFDESQHFTEPREISLSNYPEKYKVVFDKKGWISLCKELNKKDNDPPYRDEQRAWYDTMRDFAPYIIGLKPTVRLFSKDLVWCQLNSKTKKDINKFRRIIESKDIMTHSYKSTIVKNHPEFLNKKLLLANVSKSGLFKSKDGDSIQVEINNQGQLYVNKVTSKFALIPLDLSLRKIGEIYLGLKDPSVNQMLKYLVLPEMEVERIFNNLRYKYLKAIHLSGFCKPNELINACYNKAFQSLAGIQIYQGSTKSRKNNDYFWKAAGFKNITRKEINWDEDRQSLGVVLGFIKKMNVRGIGKTYVELIAIKPGFHEICIHKNYFEDAVKYDGTPRDKAFRLLRGYKEQLRLDKMPAEINRKSYFSYAPCNVTEGPFVFRKKITTSYFDEIHRTDKKDKKHELLKQFHVLFYSRVDSRKQLMELLKKAEKFRHFI